MQGNELITTAAKPFVSACQAITEEQLDAPTPCAEYTVGGLVNHLLFWGPSLLAGAHKISRPRPAEDEQQVDLVRDGWQAALLRQTEELVNAWQDPDAWQGNTYVGGTAQLPGEMVGGMVFSEFVLHGWDLSRALGRAAEWDEEVLAFTVRFLRATGELGRSYGAYGPQVSVADGSSELDVALGLSGRDPAWSPSRLAG